MIGSNETYKQLFKKYLDNSCTKNELQELIDWAKNNPQSMQEIVEVFWSQSEDKVTANNDAVFNAIIEQAMLIEQKENVTPIVSIKKKRKWLAVAAAIVLSAALSIGIKLLIADKNGVGDMASTKNHINHQTEILPGSNKAVLTLADGSTIVLDSVNNGTIATQGDMAIVKLNDGEISFQGDENNIPQAINNTISIPKGGQYRLVLSDGTKVWLNASSSLSFPNSFSGNERKVVLSGEGYFEVAKNAEKPFIVDAGTTNVQVLGTHFNIDTYKDDGADVVALMEGSVKVSNGVQTNILKPGQKAMLGTANGIKVVNDENIENTVAWVNNYFVFENSSIQDVMNQLSRWYDIKVMYKGKFNTRLNGRFKRSSNLSEALEIIKTATRLQFDIEGRVIIVKE